MRAQALRACPSTVLFFLLTCVLSASQAIGHSDDREDDSHRGWTTHSHDAQHTGVSSVAAQEFKRIHWQVPVDLAPPTGEIFIHYGSPLVTARNTVIVPVKTGPDSFRVEAHEGTSGKKLWQLNTGYEAPFDFFVPGLGATLSHHRLFVPDIAGRVLVREEPDEREG